MRTLHGLATWNTFPSIHPPRCRGSSFRKLEFRDARVSGFKSLTILFFFFFFIYIVTSSPDLIPPMRVSFNNARLSNARVVKTPAPTPRSKVG